MQSSSLKVEVTPGNQKNKYFIEDLKTHQIKEIPARDVRENRMTLDKVAGYCKQGLITAGMNSSLNEALQKGRIASNALRAKNNPAINSSAVTNGTR